MSGRWPWLIAVALLWQIGFAQPGTPAHAGAEFREPPVIRPQGNVLNVSLNVALGRNVIAGRTLETATYNGMIPGPTLRVRPGDRLAIALINNLSQPGGPPARRNPPPSAEAQAGRPVARGY